MHVVGSKDFLSGIAFGVELCRDGGRCHKSGNEWSGAFPNVSGCLIYAVRSQTSLRLRCIGARVGGGRERSTGLDMSLRVRMALSSSLMLFCERRGLTVGVSRKSTRDFSSFILYW